MRLRIEPIIFCKVRDYFLLCAREKRNQDKMQEQSTNEQIRSFQSYLILKTAGYSFFRKFLSYVCIYFAANFIQKYRTTNFFQLFCVLLSIVIKCTIAWTLITTY